MKSLIIRYIGQNSTKESSDVLKEEIRDIGDTPWVDVLRYLDELHSEGLIYKPSNSKNATLKLTAKGWKEFDKEMKIVYIGDPKQQTPVKKDAIKPKVDESPTSVDMRRLNLRVGDVTKPIAQWKVGELNNASEMELVGDCKMSQPQDKYYGRWASKISNWGNFPRKE